MIRKAVIVAAGLSSRLYPLTEDTPKGLLPIGDDTLLSRSVRLLHGEGVEEIGVVVGFRSESVRQALGGLVTVIANPFYRHCNNMGSLMMARNFVGHDRFVYLHGDLVYTASMLACFLGDAGGPAESPCLDLLVAMGEADDEAMKVRTGANGLVVESSKHVPLADAIGEWTGIAVVHKPAIVFDAIENHLMTEGLDDYDTAAFTTLAKEGFRVRCMAANGDPWKEIDTAEDLEAARAAFMT